jgi:hypothetical protein
MYRSDKAKYCVKSYQSIDFFPMTENMKLQCHRYASGLQQYPSEIRPEVEAMRGTCKCGFPWTHEKKINKAKIITSATIRTKTVLPSGFETDIDVYVGRTSQCHCKFNPDCQDLTLLNINNSYFMEYSTLTMFLGIFANGHPSCHLFTNIIKTVLNWASIVKPPKDLYKIIWSAFMSWKDLLTYDESTWLKCPNSSTEVGCDKVVGDGKSLFSNYPVLKIKVTVSWLRRLHNER